MLNLLNMKKILAILVLGLLVSGNVYAEKSEVEKQGQIKNYKVMWESVNTCWYNIDQKMTSFANKLIDDGKIDKIEKHTYDFWINLTGKVTAKFPNYDYSKCKSDDPEKEALEWKKKNTWFMVNDKMTDYAIYIHGKLVQSGIHPTKDSKAYYSEIDKQMRMKFPNYDWN